MNTETFTARKLEDAMIAVKSAYGPDALIVGSRRKVGSDGAPLFEVEAARPDSAPHTPRESREPAARRILLQNDVAASLADELTRSASAVTMREARRELVRELGERVRFTGGRPGSRVHVLVGPTGVGKTTTLAKLAARAALIDDENVVLVTADDYRVGGIEQLQRYAGLIGVPFEIASSRTQLERVLAKYPSADRFLVDTAGRSPRDRGAIREMGRTWRDLSSRPSIELCVAAATRHGELRDVLECYGALDPGTLTVTKLDEAIHFGGVVSAPFESGLPLAFFTTGQRVPEDIEAASADRLAGALCGEEVLS